MSARNASTPPAIPDLRFVVPARRESLPPARHALRAFAARYGLGPERVQAIELALAEAVGNGISHAYELEPVGPVEVTAWMLGEAIVLSVEDAGRGLPPEGSRPRSEGFGLRLIDALASEVERTSVVGGGHRVVMRFDP